MLRDPCSSWPGPFPYDVLAPVGVTPALPHAELLDVPLELLSQGLMTPDRERAWDELRRLDRRLFVDFLLYELDPATDFPAARAAVDHELQHPGEPPEVGAALSVPADLVAGLAAEVRLPPLAAAPEPDAVPELPTMPPRHLLHRLIRFDR
jgi:hypothetical protein